MATRSKDDQFKILRDEIRDVKSGLRRVEMSIEKMEDEMKITRTEIKDLRNEFHKFDKKIFDWKSELFDKIDEFIKPVRDLQEESATMNIRITRLEKKNPLN